MNSGRIRVGARWDEPAQDERLNRAFRAGLIDFAEANYPISPGCAPRLDPQCAILVHCPVNAIASPHGINFKLAEQVRSAAAEFDSPWVGEHLCWAGPGAEGRLGYIVTPPLAPLFRDVAVENVRALQTYYGRRVALELAPVYQISGSSESEMHFLAEVALEADALIILDVAHWTASNRNLSRPVHYGLSVIPTELVVELHIAGIRPGRNGRFWHDSHDLVPSEAILQTTERLVKEMPNLRAVTLEHAYEAPEEDFVAALRAVREICG